jgi:hypothetical protein
MSHQDRPFGFLKRKTPPPVKGSGVFEICFVIALKPNRRPRQQQGAGR